MKATEYLVHFVEQLPNGNLIDKTVTVVNFGSEWCEVFRTMQTYRGFLYFHVKLNGTTTFKWSIDNECRQLDDLPAV